MQTLSKYMYHMPDVVVINERRTETKQVNETDNSYGYVH